MEPGEPACHVSESGFDADVSFLVVSANLSDSGSFQKTPLPSQDMPVKGDSGGGRTHGISF